MEIVKINVTELSKDDWFLLDGNITTQVGTMLAGYFSSISTQALMNGYWQPVGDGYNMTLFYLDANVGVVVYNY